MATITTEFGSGGSNLAPNEAQGAPTLAGTLRDIADDLVLLKVATIASANASDLPTAITLVNEIKTALNAIAGGSLLTIKG
jgi:hypothetical protein